MAGRRSKGQRGRSGSLPTYEVDAKSDASYVKGARRRMAQQGRRHLLVRLLVLAAVVLAGWLWGPKVVQVIRGRATRQAEELRQAGDHLKEGRDRRSGANFDSTQ